MDSHSHNYSAIMWGGPNERQSKQTEEMADVSVFRHFSGKVCTRSTPTAPSAYAALRVRGCLCRCIAVCICARKGGVGRAHRGRTMMTIIGGSVLMIVDKKSLKPPSPERRAVSHSAVRALAVPRTKLPLLISFRQKHTAPSMAFSQTMVENFKEAFALFDKKA